MGSLDVTRTASSAISRRCSRRSLSPAAAATKIESCSASTSFALMCLARYISICPSLRFASEAQARAMSKALPRIISSVMPLSALVIFMRSSGRSNRTNRSQAIRAEATLASRSSFELFVTALRRSVPRFMIAARRSSFSTSLMRAKRDEVVATPARTALVPAASRAVRA